MSLSTEQNEELAEAFKVFDKEGKQSIPANELGALLRSLGQNPSDTEVKNMAAIADPSGSGSITLDGFQKMIAQKLQPYTGTAEVIEVSILFICVCVCVCVCMYVCMCWRCFMTSIYSFLCLPSLSLLLSPLCLLSVSSPLSIFSSSPLSPSIL
jgi:EF-hand domain pair